MSGRQPLTRPGLWAGLTLLSLTLLGGVAQATPRMSLTAGTPCAACHVNPTGGGGRTEIGFGAMSKAGALTYDQLGLGALHDVESNTWLDGLLSIGMDLRIQGARLGNPTLDESGAGTPETRVPDYTFFPMQVQPYVTLRPARGVTLYGTFGAGPETFRGKICDEVFPGMSCYAAYAMYEPADATLPTVRAGVFQPSIGIRHDDHTLFVRGDARDRRRPIIAPNYAEPGAEVIYQPVTWLRAEVGAFAPRGLDDTLNETADTADLWPVAYSGRVTFLPHIKIPYAVEVADDGFGDDDFGDDAPATQDYIINTWAGASLYGSGDFQLINGFVGLGIHEGVSLVAEVSRSERTLDYTTLNGWVGLWYTPWTWLTAAARIERANTQTANADDTTWAYVAGLEFFPVPFVEVRPEYRLVETSDYRFGQATVQVHLFY